MSPAPVALAPGVFRLPTLGHHAINSFALIDDDGTVTLIDAGLKGATRRLLAALSELGKRPADVTGVLLTHVHGDHSGGAGGLRAASGASVQIHPDDAPFLVQGSQPPPDPGAPLGPLVGLAASRGPRCPVDATFVDREVIDVAGGLQVVHTPGHTPGHCSFLLQRAGILLTGDALLHLGGRISWPLATFCSDTGLARRSAATFAQLDYEVAAFAHGPEIRHHARQAIRRFLAGHSWR